MAVASRREADQSTRLRKVIELTLTKMVAKVNTGTFDIEAELVNRKPYSQASPQQRSAARLGWSSGRAMLGWPLRPCSFGANMISQLV